MCLCVFFFFKQKTAYEMRISDWSSDVCSSDLAVDSQSGSDVVVKFPKPAVLAEPAMREAFVREALIGVRVASPFVGQVLAVGEERQGRLYTVMPFYRGETLADRLKKNGFIPLRQGLKIAVQPTPAVR